MTKTICDFCEREARYQCSIPCWSNFDSDGLICTIPNYAKIKILKADLCEVHAKKFADFTVSLATKK